MARETLESNNPDVEIHVIGSGENISPEDRRKALMFAEMVSGGSFFLHVLEAARGVEDLLKISSPEFDHLPDGSLASERISSEVRSQFLMAVLARVAGGHLYDYMVVQGAGDASSLMKRAEVLAHNVCAVVACLVEGRELGLSAPKE